MNGGRHIEKARRVLAGGHHLLIGGFTEAAGREAYLAALHAALAFISVRTGKTPKTHRGVRSEFARLTRDDAGISPDFVSFLGRAYELKTVADYDDIIAVSPADAGNALSAAERMIEAIAALIT